MSTKDNKSSASPEADNPANKTVEPAKDLDSPENRQKKKKEEKEKKLKNIKLRLDRSNLSDDTKKLAATAIDSDDENELNLVEQLLSRTIVMTQDEFAKKLAEIREKKAKIKKGEILPSLETNLKVKNTVFSKLKNTEIPGDKKKVNEKIKNKSKEIEKLNETHKATVQEILDLLAPAIKDKKITEEDALKIAQLDPSNTDKFGDIFYKLLGGLIKDKMLVHNILGVKKKQKEINEKFEDTLADVKELIEKETKEYFYAKEKLEKVRSLSRTTGIKLFEGQQLEYMGVSSKLKRTQTKLRINTIDYGRQSSSADNLAPDLSAEEIREIENAAVNLEKVLKINLTIDREDGTSETVSMEELEFIRFLDLNEANEVINSQSELEQKIGFEEFEQSIRTGMELEYVKDRQVNGFPIYEKIKIDKIDRENGKIWLNNPVNIMTYARQDSGVIRNRYKSELTFGEFAKWFIKYRAEQKMNLDEARKTVKQMPHILKLRYPNADPSVVEFNDLPIEIKKGEKLKYGNNREAKIKDVKDDEILLSTGEKFTPGQFVRFVKEHEVEKADKLQIPDDIAQKIEEAVESNKEAKNEDGSNLETNVTPDEAIGPLSEIWAGLTFLSPRDIMKVIDTSKEFFKRRYERNSKRRAANTGKNFLGRWGTEFKNLTQTAENEEVSKYESDMEQNGIWYIQERFHATQSPDEFKACINLLTKKGAFNFNDGQVWESMNRMLYIMKPQSEAKEWKINYSTENAFWGTKYIPLQNEHHRLPVDAMKDMLSELWGQPGGSEWFNQNDGAYDGLVGKFVSEATNLESDPYNNGGPAGALQDMLCAHLDDRYVEPARYEAFIKQIITAGKAEYEDKVFYMIAGLCAKNKRGETLLNNVRISQLNTLMNSLPHLDFFVQYRRDGDSERMSKEAVYELYNRFVSGVNGYPNRPTSKPGDKLNRYNYGEVRKFLWEDVMTHNRTIVRAKKAVKDGAIDHEDVHASIVMVDEAQVLADVVSNRNGASKFTAIGLANGIAGYGQYMKALGNVTIRSPEKKATMKKEGFEDPVQLIRQTFKAWNYYEAQICGRVSFNPNYRTISDEDINKPPFIDSVNKTVKQHASEMRELLRQILQAYGMKNSDIYDYLDFKSTTLKEDDIKKAHLSKMKTFPSVFDKLVNRDNGAQMVEIVQQAIAEGRLRGLEGVSQMNSKSLAEAKEKSSEGKSMEEIGSDFDNLNNQEEVSLVEKLNQHRARANKTLNGSLPKNDEDEEDDSGTDDQGNKVT